MSDQGRDEGLAQLQAGDLDKAASLLRRAVEDDPQDALAQSYLGICMLRQGQVDAGLEALRSAAVLAPENATVVYNYARALHQDNRLEAARSELEKLVAMHPDHTNARALLEHLQTGDSALTSAAHPVDNPVSGLQYTPAVEVQQNLVAPGLGLRVGRGLMWGALFGQWWTMWTLFSMVLWGSGAKTSTAVLVITAIMMAVIFGVWGALTGVAIAFVRKLQHGVTVGIAAGLLCCVLEAVYLGGSMLNVLFYFVTGRYVGAKITSRVHAPVVR